MPIREDILVPIPGENPSGVDLRYDPVYDKIKEARRQDLDLNQGAWQSELKTANWPLVLKLTQETLATRSKDLQIGDWLTEGLLQTERFAGLRQGLDFLNSLAAGFWDTVHPAIDPSDPETREERAAPLAWINLQLDLPIRSTPINNAGHSSINYKDSRIVGYEDQVKTDKDRKARSVMITDGKMAPEVFDKAFNETPKAFYLQAEKDLDACLATVATLENFCDEKLGNDWDGLGKLKTTLTDVRLGVHQLLEKKREKEPDPIEVVPEEPAATPELAGEAEDGMAAPAAAIGTALIAEPADRRQAIAGVVAAAAFLRKREPLSPAPYLLLRGLRWGELRSAPRLADSPMLEAPPTDVRQQVKRLAIAKKWADLLEAGEQAMALPGSRAWLDLQRLSVAACTALGKEYFPIATAIQSELRALLNDLPELLDATLLDDTPAANPETKAWLQGLSAAAPAPSVAEEEAAETRAHRNGAPTWLAPAVDAFALAQDALAAGQEEKAFAIMRADLSRQRSGRRRFRRTMQMVELAIAAGKDGIAQPLLEDIAALIENHKLDAWEEPEQIASDLIKLMRYSKKIQGSAADKQKLFDRICRLDPVQALSVG
ncbi:MAG TPA: type VI secretion system protein TssA [Terracidiphilus sp.]|jgi:type VI secretion system protein ImpA